MYVRFQNIQSSDVVRGNASVVPGPGPQSDHRPRHRPQQRGHCRGHHHRHQSGYRHQDYQCHQRCGQLVVRGMAFGSYEIACEAKGFRKYLRRSNLNVAQTLTIDITLEIGAVDQTVEVSGAAPLIESSTSDLGTVVDQKQVRDLPLSVSGNMRNPESFVLLAPGVTGYTANNEINGSQDRVHGA